MTTISTNRIGMTADGTVYGWTPEGMVTLGQIRPSISYGAPQQLNRGDPLPPGFWEVLDGSVSADLGDATIRQVIIGS